VTLGHR